MLITSNRSVGEWGTVFGDPVVATAILDRLLHHSHVITIRGDSYRLREKRRAGLVKSAPIGAGAKRVSRACPGGSTGPSRARRSVAREGTARHARGPPVDYLDKPCHPSAFKATGVQFFVSPGVQFRMSFDSGYVSQIVTTTSLIAMVKGRMVKRTRTPAARMNAACNIMRKKTCRSLRRDYTGLRFRPYPTGFSR